jgi:predicted pyridoxine 5'-phosphate oxidase superfamily flavin-nucleotide-binding protein
MRNAYLEVATTPAVVAARERWDGIDRYPAGDGPLAHDRLGPAEKAFIAACDGFYLGSVSETGWPYIQFRGGPRGFLRVLDDRALGYADFRGNRQYLTMGNVARNDRVALFLMDYANGRRLKLFGHLSVVEDPGFAREVALPGYKATIERAVRIEVVAFDWNCPQHIPLRYTPEELAEVSCPHRR